MKALLFVAACAFAGPALAQETAPPSNTSPGSGTVGTMPDTTMTTPDAGAAPTTPDMAAPTAPDTAATTDTTTTTDTGSMSTGGMTPPANTTMSTPTTPAPAKMYPKCSRTMHDSCTNPGGK